MHNNAWGKTDENGRPSHHLIHHSMDVATVFHNLIAQPVFADRIAMAAGRDLDAGEREWLAALAFLHDVGKLSPRFQAKAWPEAHPGDTRGHLGEGWHWLETIARRSDAMGGAALELFNPIISARAGNGWVQALFAHHGRPSQGKASPPWRVQQGYDWQAQEALMGEALRAWFARARWGDGAALKSARFVHLFAGLLTLADWIGSDAHCFPHRLEPDIANYGETARERAEQALARFKVTDSPWPARAPSFETLTTFAPRGIQALIGAVPPENPLAIIEAETGSGKTEAALWHFSRLRAAGVVDSLYFAVPTRAAATQLHHRIEETMKRIGGPEAILAVPGQLRAGDAQGVRLPGFAVRWDDGDAHWAAEHATRFLAAPVAVGTIDQVLMAGLQVKHAHVRGSALSRSLLVIDEVHASDGYMNKIAQTLARDHLALGGRALLMSATLGAGARAQWLGQALPDLETASHVPYPALWRSDASEPAVPEAQDVRSKRVTLEREPTMDGMEAATRALEAARDGARVLVIRNTVDAALETFRAVVAADPALCLSVAGCPSLHHARFAAEDRHALDRAVEDAFGKKSGAKPVIAIGTQTLEQSLDIDADLLITDLCPMDVLLQRIGRLHRHDRSRPEGFADPRVHLLCPERGLDRLAKEKRFENGLGAWRSHGSLVGIYSDLCGLEATRRLAGDRPVWAIPKDNRALVEAATHPDALAAIEEEMGWQDYMADYGATELADRQTAGLLALDRAEPFPDRFRCDDEIVQTRLGARGPLLTLPAGTIGPFGHAISTIAPPAHWCRTDDAQDAWMRGEEPVAVDDHGDGTLSIRAGAWGFLYGREGLSRIKL